MYVRDAFLTIILKSSHNHLTVVSQSYHGVQHTRAAHALCSDHCFKSREICGYFGSLICQVYIITETWPWIGSIAV